MLWLRLVLLLRLRYRYGLLRSGSLLLLSLLFPL
jgi:hypothetical protein